MKVIIEDVLATDGIGELEWSKKERWAKIKRLDDWRVVDVRDELQDEPGNPLWLYERLINLGSHLINKYGKVLICCTTGISRSNAIAAGILMKKYGYSYQAALDLLHEKVKIDLIEPTHLNALKKLEKKWSEVIN